MMRTSHCEIRPSDISRPSLRAPRTVAHSATRREGVRGAARRMVVCAHGPSRSNAGGDPDTRAARNLAEEQGKHSPTASATQVAIAARLTMLATCTTVLTVVVACTPSAAIAATRRHTRRREERDDEGDSREASKTSEKQEDSFTIKVPSVKKIKREVKKVQRKVMGQVDELTKPISKKLGFSEQVRLKKDGSFVTVVPQAPPGFKTAVGWGAAGLFALLVWKILFPSKAKDDRKGKWVKDRSLGGKEIFVEAEDYAGSSVASDEKTKRWRKALDLPGASPLDDPNLRSESTYGAKPASAAVPTLQEPPTWWETSPPAYVPEAQREARQRQSQMVLKRVLDKRLAGKDIDEFDLLELRQSCQDNNTVVKIPQESIRDSVYRTAVDVVLTVAARGTTVVGSSTPRRFVCGLAEDLAIAETRAADMLRAGQAAKVRGLLLSAAASIRKGDDIECIMTMRQVTAVFSPFPPPPRTPEMEMVAAALEPMSSTTERDQLLATFIAYGGADFEYLGRECLGIN